MVRALSAFCMVVVAGGFGTRKLGVGKIAVAFIPSFSELFLKSLRFLNLPSSCWDIKNTKTSIELREKFSKLDNVLFHHI